MWNCRRHKHRLRKHQVNIHNFIWFYCHEIYVNRCNRIGCVAIAVASTGTRTDFGSKCNRIDIKIRYAAQSAWDRCDLHHFYMKYFFFVLHRFDYINRYGANEVPFLQDRHFFSYAVWSYKNRPCNCVNIM